MRTTALGCLCAALLGCEATVPASTTGTAPAQVSTPISGRVVDDRGVGLAGVHLLFHDTTRRTGHVDSRGCATYHPQFSLTSGEDGRFSAVLPFAPTRVQADGPIEWVTLPPPQTITDPTKELILVGRSVPHATLTGQVVDAEGQPIANVSVQPESGYGARGQRSDEEGRFKLEIAEPLPERFRVRRMGYRPLVVERGALERVVLAVRRPMITVMVHENGAPVQRLVTVALSQQGQRLSFCTAGPAVNTHEPRDGECSLDAEPGQVELLLDNEEVKKLRVGDQPQQVTVTAPALPPQEQLLRRGDRGY